MGWLTELAGAVSFPLGQHNAGPIILVYCLLSRLRDGAKVRLKLKEAPGSVNTILFPSWSRYDDLLAPNMDREGGVKFWLTPAPRTTKDAPHESSTWGFKKSNIQTVDPDSPLLLTKKLQYKWWWWTLRTVLHFTSYSLNASRRNQSDIVAKD